jgi:hypothetical protein
MIYRYSNQRLTDLNDQELNYLTRVVSTSSGGLVVDHANGCWSIRAIRYRHRYSDQRLTDLDGRELNYLARVVSTLSGGQIADRAE